MAFKQRRFVPLLVTLTVLGLVVLGVLIIKLARSSPSSVPSNILQKANFTVFYPAVNAKAPVTVQPASMSYNSASNGLSYVALVDSKKVIVTEQATPDVFSQSGVYSFKLDQAHEYDSFDSAAGEVALTKPDELQGQTLAWDNTKGTLILAHALQDLTKSEWQELFNNLRIIKS